MAELFEALNSFWPPVDAFEVGSVADAGAGQVGRPGVGELWALEEQVDCAFRHAESAVLAFVRVDQAKALQIATGGSVAGDERHGEVVDHVEEVVLFEFEIFWHEVLRVLELLRVDSVVPGSQTASFDVRSDRRDGHLIEDFDFVRVGARLGQLSRLAGAGVGIGRCPLDSNLLVAGSREDFG